MRRLACLAALAATPLAAQGPEVGGVAGTTARTGVVSQTYVLGSGLAFDRISELVVPVTVTQRVGRRLRVDVATAFASASVRTVGDGGTIDLSGVVDTDVRATVAVVPGRLLLTVVGTLPTGTGTVPDTTLPLYGATATDLLDFMVPTFGGGGAVTVGLASAFPLGAGWAVGTGASYRAAGSYVPLTGGEELSPGGEGRVRLGVEGPLGGGAYLRGVLVYTTVGRDEFAGGQESMVGDRALVYAALNLPVGRGALSLYAWNMRRFRPRGFDDPGTTTSPRGNVLALGARFDRPVSPALALSPAVELRHELSGYERLELLGWVVRTGADLRWRLGGRATVVLQGHLAVGRLRDEGTTVSLLGPRAGAVLEWSP